jgi:hypothetical protein
MKEVETRTPHNLSPETGNNLGTAYTALVDYYRGSELSGLSYGPPRLYALHCLKWRDNWNEPLLIPSLMDSINLFSNY